jgi:hypothetical protein
MTQSSSLYVSHIYNFESLFKNIYYYIQTQNNGYFWVPFLQTNGSLLNETFSKVTLINGWICWDISKLKLILK